MAILVPGFPRLKEWAYAGMFFNMTGAAISHASVSDYGAKRVPPHRDTFYRSSRGRLVGAATAQPYARPPLSRYIPDGFQPQSGHFAGHLCVSRPCD
jgi:hypothetical protein